MKEFHYVTRNEIAVKNFDDALKLVDILLTNEYVTMISKEENLYIINYIWSVRGSDRNDVCFQDREAVEEFIFNCTDEEE